MRLKHFFVSLRLFDRIKCKTEIVELLNASLRVKIIKFSKYKPKTYAKEQYEYACNIKSFNSLYLPSVDYSGLVPGHFSLNLYKGFDILGSVCFTKKIVSARWLNKMSLSC